MPAETSSLVEYTLRRSSPESVTIMSTDVHTPTGTNPQRYEAVLRISEAIVACHEPEELARTLADALGEFLHFDHLYLMILNENSREIESMVWGKGPLPLADL